MAQFTKVNGDFQQVLWLDAPAYVNNGLNAVSANVTVQPQGPKLDFFTVTAAGALSGTQVQIAMQAVEQLATIHIYQINDDTNDSIALALYPTAAWADSTLEAAIEAALTAGGVSNNVTVTTGATFAG